MKVLKHIKPWQVVVAGSMTLFVAVTFWLAGWWKPVEFQTGSVVLADGSVIQVEVADSPAEYSQGLMDREQIDPESGMLFLLPQSGTYTFWMKNTHVDLDFIWLSQNTVVDLRSQVPAGAGLPDDQIARVQPQQAIDAALEVPAGFIDRHHIQIGDKLVYQLP